jgi:hypothetical protein
MAGRSRIASTSPSVIPSRIFSALAGVIAVRGQSSHVTPIATMLAARMMYQTL